MPSEPVAALSQNVRALLLLSVRRLFLNVSSWRSKKRQSTEDEKRSPQLAIRRTCNSSSVMSGRRRSENESAQRHAMPRSLSRPSKQAGSNEPRVFVAQADRTGTRCGDEAVMRLDDRLRRLKAGRQQSGMRRVVHRVIGLDARFAQNSTLRRKSRGIRAVGKRATDRARRRMLGNPVSKPLSEPVLRQSPRERLVSVLF